MCFCVLHFTVKCVRKCVLWNERKKSSSRIVQFLSLTVVKITWSEMCERKERAKNDIYLWNCKRRQNGTTNMRKTEIDRDSCASFIKQCINATNKMVKACSKQQRLAAPTHHKHIHKHKHTRERAHTHTQAIHSNWELIHTLNVITIDM